MDIRYEVDPQDQPSWQHCVDGSADGHIDDRGDGPAWTRLACHQCEHCPLSTRDYTFCPLARALQPVLRTVADSSSYQPVRVRVVTPERDVVKVTSMQRAIGSLFGVVSVFSGCPRLALLRPLGRVHLPFSSSDETVMRVIGSYLTGQFVRAQHGLDADWQLQGLRALYRDIRKVNRAISARLREIATDDASANSMVLLDVLATDVEYTLDRYEGELDKLFAEFLPPAP